MGVGYNGLKLVWLKQAATNQSFIEWISPPAGDVGTFSGSSEVYVGMKVKVVNAAPPVFTISDGSVPPGLTIDQKTGAIYGTANNLAGSYEFTLTATSDNASVSRTFTSNVVVNQAPVWVSNAGSLGSGFDNTLASIQLEAVDPEGQDVSYSVLTGSLPLGLTLAANTGLISGRLGSVPDNTTYFFTVRASDGTLNTDRAFSYTTNYNAPPVWVTEPYPNGGYLGGTVIESYPFSVQLSATDSTGGQTITYQIISGMLPEGMTLNSNTGVISGTAPSVNRDKEYPLEISASDGYKATGAKFRIKVARNVPPVWISVGNIGSDFAETSVSYTLLAADPNGRPVTFSLDANTALPVGLTLNGNTGVISGTLPAVEETTLTSFTVYVSDGVSAVPRSLGIVTLLDAPPVWTTPANLGTGLEGTNISKQFVATDPTGANRSPTFSTPDGLPSGLSLSSSGLLSGTLSSVLADAAYSFNVVAAFGAQTSSREFSFLVANNVPPVWTTAAGELFSELGKTQASFQLVAADPNGTGITYAITSGALPSGLSMTSGGLISGNLPDVGNTTVSTFTVAASDGVTTPAEREFSITVRQNLKPVWNTPAGSLGSAFETMPFTVTLSATDPEGTPIKYGNMPGSVLPLGLSLNRDTGVISGSLPLVAQDTETTFTLFADDGSVNEGGRTTRIFSILTKFNSPPVFGTGADLGTAVEKYAYDRQLEASGVGNGPMVYTLISGALPVGVTLSSAGRLSGTLPAAATLDTYTFTIRAFNGIKEATREFTLRVAHNVAPTWTTAAGSLGSFYFGKPIYIPLTATDPNGTPVSFSLASGTLPSGVALLNGTLTGKMDTLTQANAVSTFTIAAGDGVLSTNRVFTITQLADTSPAFVTAAGSLGTVLKNKTFSFTIQATDQEGSAMTYSLVSGSLPTGAVLNSTSGVITGTAPNVSTTTVSTFTIRASDGINTAERTFSITVDTDTAPVWDTPAGSIGSILSGYSGTFILSATDPEGVTLTYSLTSGSVPPNMTLSTSGSIGPQGASTIPLSYTDTEYNFVVSVSDGNNTVPRSFSITTRANLDPVWTTAAGSLGSYIEGVVIANAVVATDPDGLPLTYAISNGSLPSALSLNGSTGEITGTLGNVVANTTTNFTVTANDAKRTSSRAFSYTVIFNSPPSFSTAANLGSYIEQSPVNVTIVATSNEHPVTYALKAGSTLPSGVTLAGNTGVISGTLPAVTSTQVYNFTIVATDTVTTKTAERTFSLTSQDNLAPVWTTAAGSLLNDLAGTAVNLTLVATDPNGTPVEYVLVSGTIPNTVVFANTGTLTGTLPMVGNNTTYSFTIGAFDGFIRTDRSFSLTSQLDEAPIWQNATTLPSGIEGDAYSKLLIATDPNGKTITYTNTTAMPSGLRFLSNGYVTGTLQAVSSNTTVEFTLLADDGTMSTANTFSLVILDDRAPVWTTASGSLGSIVERNFVSYTVVATDPEGRGVTYALAANTTVPSGMTLFTANGVIRGTPDTVISDTTSNFTVRASDPAGNFTDRNFSITVTASATEYDPWIANVVIQMPMQGTVGTVPIEVAQGLTVTSQGTGALIRSTPAKWSGRTVAQVSPGNFSRVTHTGQVTCPGDLSIEAWVYPTAHAGGFNAIFASYVASPTTNDDFILYTAKGAATSDPGTILLYIGGGSVAVGGVTMPINNWYHMAVSRSGNVTRVFKDGVLCGSTTSWTGSFGVLGAVNYQPASFGGYDSAGSSGFTGYITDYRITKGIARYTAAFTPPAKPFA